MPEDSIPIRDASPTPGPQDRQPGQGLPVPRPKNRRRSLPEGLRTTGYGLSIAVGLAVSILGFIRFADAYDAAREYRATPACGAPAARPAPDCVRQESGRVTKKAKKDDGDSTDYELTVARETAPTASYGVGEAFYDDVEAGTTVDLKVLRGRVVELGYHGHRSPNPSTPWRSIITFSLLLAVGMAVAVIGYARSWLPPLGAAVLVWVFTALGGGLMFFLDWPVAVVLAIGVVCWLFAALVIAVAASDF